MSSTPSDALALATQPRAPEHSDDDYVSRNARRAWHGFHAIAAGDPDGEDPFDVGAVNAIANILHAVALDPNAPRSLDLVAEAAVAHASTEIAEAATQALAPNGEPWGDVPPDLYALRCEAERIIGADRVPVDVLRMIVRDFGEKPCPVCGAEGEGQSCSDTSGQLIDDHAERGQATA